MASAKFLIDVKHGLCCANDVDHIPTIPSLEALVDASLFSTRTTGPATDSPDTVSTPPCLGIFPPEPTSADLKVTNKFSEISPLADVFVCPVPNCGKAFTTRETLFFHARSHSDWKEGAQRRFLCDWPACGRAYKLKCSLQKHRKVHTSPFPFTCSDCGKVFGQSCNLSRHRRIHTGEKPYRCDMPNCNRRFSRRDDLTTHLRIHKGETPYACPKCAELFVTAAELQRHQHKSKCS